MPTYYAKLGAAITIPFGQVLDSTGAEFTTLVVGEVKICKNNGTPAALNGSATLTHKEFGFYELVLTTSDISAVGQATLTVSKTTYVAPPISLIVLPAKVYDSIVGGTDNLEVDMVQLLGTAPTEGAAGRLAGGITKFFNVASPTGTVNSLPDAVAGTTNGVTIAGSNAATTFATLTVSGAVTMTDLVNDIQTAITGGAYDLDTDANGRIRHVVGTGAGELDTANGIVLAQLADAVNHGGTTATFEMLSLAIINDVTGKAVTIQSDDDTAVDILSNSLTNYGINLRSLGIAGLNIEAIGGIGIQIFSRGNAISATSDLSNAVELITNASGFHGLRATLSPETLASFFNTSSGTNYAASIAGSIVKEIADNAGGSTPPTAAAIATAVWTDLLASTDFSTAASIGKLLKDDVDAAISTRTKPADTQARVALVDVLTTYTSNTPQTGDSFAVVNSGTFGNAALKALIDALPTDSENAIAADALITLSHGGGSYVRNTEPESANDIALEVLDLTDAIEAGLTLREAMRLAASASAGKLSGATTPTVTIRNAVADSKDRITASVDGSGNRTAIVYDLSD